MKYIPEYSCPLFLCKHIQQHKIIIRINRSKAISKNIHQLFAGVI